MRWHPDSFSCKGAKQQKEAEEQFQKINDAYEFLTDAQRKGCGTRATIGKRSSSSWRWRSSSSSTAGAAFLLAAAAFRGAFGGAEARGAFVVCGS